MNWRSPAAIKLEMLGIVSGKKYIAGPLAIQVNTSPEFCRFGPPVVSDEQFRAALAAIAASRDAEDEAEDEADQIVGAKHNES